MDCHSRCHLSDERGSQLGSADDFGHMQSVGLLLHFGVSLGDPPVPFSSAVDPNIPYTSCIVGLSCMLQYAALESIQ